MELHIFGHIYVAAMDSLALAMIDLLNMTTISRSRKWYAEEWNDLGEMVFNGRGKIEFLFFSSFRIN